MFTRIDEKIVAKAKKILKERNLTCVSIVRQLFKVLIKKPNEIINVLYTD